MKKSLAHLPKLKQDELKRIVDKISERAEAEMIILFGSYTRDDWVEDTHAEGHITHVYPDYDILVATKTKKQLEYLGQRVKILQRLTNKICKGKIESFAN